MATFEATRNQRVQQHFEILELDLPVITGACTLGSDNGFGTPLTCDQAWAGEYKTYYFTTENAPIIRSINGESVYRCIKSISLTPTELKPGNGLSSRASLKVVFTDFDNRDPNSYAPGVTQEVIESGSFFGKLSERQVIENKSARLKNYRVESDGSIDLTNGAETYTFIANTLKVNTTNSEWALECKDVLSLVNLNEKSWPITSGGYLRLDIDDTTTSIPVDGDTDYSSAQVVRIGKEHFKVSSVTDNLSPTATLTVGTRGANIIADVSAVKLTSTIKDEHSAGDEVFICDVSDNETIDSLLTRILTESDLDAIYIPSAEWAAEVAEWHALDKINTIHSESESVNDVINRILTGYLMDLWFDIISGEVKLSAISVWKESTATLTEGKEINAYSIKKEPQDALRASRALVIYDKNNLADSDDTTSYNKGAKFSDETLIGPELFGKHKDKLFDNNFLLNKDSADLLTQRYVSRFKFTPFLRSWTTDERYLTFKTGDVVDVITTADQSASGLISNNIRAQILSIKPNYTANGRTYSVKSMTYEAAFNTGSEIVLSSPLGSVNLYTLAGAPSQSVELTFVLDGSYSKGKTAIRAGAFPVGSKLIIILANGFDGQADGGNGGKGQSVEYDPETASVITQPAKNGGNGGIVFDAQGVDCDIYFSGATPSVAYPTADGYIRAPSGGDGGFNYTGTYPNLVSGDGGDGGDGRSQGVGGQYGTVTGSGATNGNTGSNGEIDGTGSGWGVDGVDNSASKGLAGSGVVDNGATVTFYGDTPTRYVNGNGSHP